jgi:hypothetical protein
MLGITVGYTIRIALRDDIAIELWMQLASRAARVPELSAAFR